jgi:hypothetical protein
MSGDAECIPSNCLDRSSLVERGASITFDCSPRVTFSGPEMASDALTFLAARLHWRMEQLDPGLEDEPSWGSLTDRERAFYLSCVMDLLAFPYHVRLAMTGGTFSTLTTT